MVSVRTQVALMRPRSEPTPRRGDFRVWREIPTRWRDNDHYGHVNNAVYYDYFDTAINGFLMDAVGADIRDLTAIGVVAETGCRYLKELTFPDVLQIGIALEKVGRASVIYRLGIFRGVDEEPSAIGRFVHVYVDRQTREVAELPPVIRAALSRLQLE